MAKSSTIDVYFEIGTKRVIAGAIDWPGWCRVGRDEESALQALLDYAPRYKKILRSPKLDFTAPDSIDDFKVVERIDGNATTDFGAPDAAPSADSKALQGDDLERYQKIMEVCLRALNRAMNDAEGKELRKGPRGGGRDLDKIVHHVLDANAGYLRRIVWQMQKSATDDLSELIKEAQKATHDALEAASSGELPERGPRGGKIWTPRFYVRRAAWHILDHVWEIEDRSA